MAKPPAPHMRVTFYVTYTHWTETSDEVEVRLHSQHGTGLMRAFGTSHIVFPMPRVGYTPIPRAINRMIEDRLGAVWWKEARTDAAYVPDDAERDPAT